MEKAPPPTERCEEEQQRAKNLLEEDNKHGCKLKEDVACIKVDKNVIRDAEQDKTAVCECSSDTDTDEGNFTSAEVVQKKVIATALPGEYMKLEAHEKLNNGTPARAAQEKAATAVLSEECLKHETLGSPKEEWCFNNGVLTSTESKECPLLSENIQPHDGRFAGGSGT
uniref:Uncharacterized protein n=1 Tax=Parascaris equorum TaxID=6256 RepID=A0A914R1D7_PAREQ